MEGDTSMNGPWFDEFHKKYPNIPIGCSEYGCEALNWHTSNPEQGDYTEEYQAYYHEELIKQFFTRKYMWANTMYGICLTLEQIHVTKVEKMDKITKV